MTQQKDIWIVIPAYNEDAVIAEVVTPLEFAGYSVVLVDDGSKEPLVRYLTSHRVHVCRHMMNLGQGAALQTGIYYALARGAEYVVMFDADGQHDYLNIPDLLKPLMAGEADVALGTRFAAGGEALNIPKLKERILRLAVLFTRVTTGLNVTDTHNGFRAFSAAAAKRIRITQNGMAHATQILLEIKHLKLRFVEVPVKIRYTEYSVRKGQRISNMFNILWESAMERFRL